MVKGDIDRKAVYAVKPTSTAYICCSQMQCSISDETVGCFSLGKLTVPWELTYIKQMVAIIL